MVVNMYLEDLTDSELLMRPAENMNHIAWQLGHLIQSEHMHVSQVAPDAMPALPEGFTERHTKETAASNEPGDFLTKAEYIVLMQQQREASLKLLATMSDEQLSQPAPEKVNYLGPTVGCIFAGEATHWMLHAGQWAVLRRQLNRPPLF